MSAESPIRSRSHHHHQQPDTNKSRTGSIGAGGVVGGSPPSTGMVVLPQPVTDPTIMDSVAGFISDVVPAGYSGTGPALDTDDKIQWAEFERLDTGENDGSPATNPLVLVLGYINGIQIWAIPASGEATEILSWRHSCFRVLRFIPTPYKVGNSADSTIDCFASARPLVALCDSTVNYSTLVFRSLKKGVVDPVKQIQFKTSIMNVLANKRSVVVLFPEKIAVFDSFTLETRVSITTCYLSPGIQPNPVALGSRWLAYAEKKMYSSNRSGGGNEGEGVQTYTAAVLHVAKSLGRGLKELTGTVAGSLTGTQSFRPGTSPNSPQAGGASDVPEKGVITVLDIENKNINPHENTIPQDAVIAHFVAHNEAVVCMQFDPSGMLLLTADKRGHDFHVFRIQPHPTGPSLAAVHHLYILHRGDTSAKVQDMCFSPDSRWVAVSTLRGTTHVFPVTPYGGNINYRTHASPHVVNKLSRYQRSAGLTSEGRSSSPVGPTATASNAESPSASSIFPYKNPRFPPYPQPTVIQPLAQIRQPVYQQASSNAVPPKTLSGRQRTPSSSEDNIFLRVVACFAAPRARMDPMITKSPRDAATSISHHHHHHHHKQPVRPVESLFVMSCLGRLVQYDLEPLPSSSVPKERVSNDTPIELRAPPKAVWMLQRHQNSPEIPLPMSDENLLNYVMASAQTNSSSGTSSAGVPPSVYGGGKNNRKQQSGNKPDSSSAAAVMDDERWLPQVEMTTHLGPHRRLWMGPQFTFKTYTVTNGAVVDTRIVDVRRSKPVNMPVSKAANAVVIESGSASSCEQLFLDTYQRSQQAEAGTTTDGGAEVDEFLSSSAGDLRLKEDLADAMLESPGIRGGEQGGHCVIVSMKQPTVAAGAATSQPRSATSTTTQQHQQQVVHTTKNVVNPLGTVVTVNSSDDDEPPEFIEDAVIYENVDESLFRPIITKKPQFYDGPNGGKKLRSCPPDHILTKSLDANTEVAVRIINSGNKKKTATKTTEEIKKNTNNLSNNKTVSSTISSTAPSSAAKQQIHINNNSSTLVNNSNVSNSSSSSSKPKSREQSPKPPAKVKSPSSVKKESTSVSTKSHKSELNNILLEPTKQYNKPTPTSKSLSGSKNKTLKDEIIIDHVTDTTCLPTLLPDSEKRTKKQILDDYEFYSSSQQQEDNKKPTDNEAILADNMDDSLFLASCDFDHFLDKAPETQAKQDQQKELDSLPDLSKFEKFEDAEDCGLVGRQGTVATTAPTSTHCGSIHNSHTTRSDFEITPPSSSVEDDKSSYATRKTRKPKAKLGVKIPSSLTNSSETKSYSYKPEKPHKVYTVEAEPQPLPSSNNSDVIVITQPPKKAWNVIAASAPAPKLSQTQNVDLLSSNLEGLLPNSGEVDCVETFTFKLSPPQASAVAKGDNTKKTDDRKSVGARSKNQNLIDIIDMDSEKEEQLGKLSSDDEFKCFKSGKQSSDDENNLMKPGIVLGSSSSATETTTAESSDESASKIPAILDADEADPAQMVQSGYSAKAKKKSKKKRK